MTMITTDSPVEVQLHENKGRLYTATEDIQTATEGYLGYHQDYVAIRGLLGLRIRSHGVCNLRNL
jgi:hypothetical protein